MNMTFDIAFFLTAAVGLTGAILLFDRLIFAKQRTAGSAAPLAVEAAHSFFPVLLVVLLIRSFLIQPYRVPTGSLEPTILPGDFILVNQYAYGLRLPVVNQKIYEIGRPKRGDIALFRYPHNLKLLYIKRVIGLPGDHIVYKDKQLTINGQLVTQQQLGLNLDLENEMPVMVIEKREKLDQVEHHIFLKANVREEKPVDLVVPKDCYFMMGDNRDSSSDSRSWGVVPEKLLVGKAMNVIISWDSVRSRVRWERIGEKII